MENGLCEFVDKLKCTLMSFLLTEQCYVDREFLKINFTEITTIPQKLAIIEREHESIAEQVSEMSGMV